MAVGEVGEVSRLRLRSAAQAAHQLLVRHRRDIEFAGHVGCEACDLIFDDAGPGAVAVGRNLVVGW
jgi:hypothetical protein